MRILHVFRTPVGGLFRHVRDLARGQQAEGHSVGILCDSESGGDAATRLLAGAEPYCALGTSRIPISRLPGLGDISGIRQTRAHAQALRPDVIHGHGAKGGLHGRLAARLLGIASVYTPHGGSLHYDWRTPAGALFLGTERLLAQVGSGLLFVCQFERDSFAARIGIGGKPHAVVHNGLWPEEFIDVPAAADAAEVLFIGEIRELKGLGVLLEALAICRKERPLRAAIVGDGPDTTNFIARAARLGLADAAVFHGRVSAAEAFRLGRVLVMPSLAESFPYVVLEAIAAGKPIIASKVGGIPEVLPEPQMVPPGDPDALARRLLTMVGDLTAAKAQAQTLKARLATGGGAGQMAREVTDFYRRLNP